MAEELPRKRGPWEQAYIERGETHKSRRQMFEDTVNAIFKETKEREIELGSEMAAMLVFASYFLNHPYAEFYEEFRIEPNGTLTPGTERDISLTAWAPASGPKDGCVPDDIRTAAARFNQTFPHVRFDFEEDRHKQIFSYKATLPDA